MSFYGWVDDITSFEVDWSHGADLHMLYVPTHPPFYSLAEV